MTQDKQSILTINGFTEVQEQRMLQESAETMQEYSEARRKGYTDIKELFDALKN